MNLDENYWDNRYKDNEIQWDLGTVSPPLKAYIDTLEDKSLHILIPGAGNAHEAEYLHQLGFANVYIVDLSQTALNNFSARVSSFPKAHLIHRNFFDLDQSFDLILEQTFFCALNPELRPKYVDQMHHCLNENGILAGVLFGVGFESDGPPFGGTKEEYESLFFKLFSKVDITPCYNSVTPRMGRELFIQVTK